MNLLAALQKQRRNWLLAEGFSLIALVGIGDTLIGYEHSFSVFYVIPISFVTWLVNRRFGLLTSLASALVWLGADIATEHPYSDPLIPYWNSLIRLIFFVIITLLLAALKRAGEREQEAVRIDFVTGAVTSRAFHEQALKEIDRARRYGHPFTVAYLDLDNFKTINDRFGHATGDEVLRCVAGYAKRHLRKIDVIGRLGGDEFALLLPETDQEAARAALEKLRSGILEEMRGHGWPVTLSIGVVSCSVPRLSLTELLQKADELMYSVKHAGKDAIRYGCLGTGNSEGKG
ncbi:MAG: GGDEF domain-containing protein [Deltaproteobacteria bacterium]|nr:GGDEF domain-containing protein [Deltaproteobacteria bacterium]